MYLHNSATLLASLKCEYVFYDLIQGALEGSRALQAMCGVTIRFDSRASSNTLPSVVVSCSSTSMPALQTPLFCSACSKASASTRPQRTVFINRASRFFCFRTEASMMWRVSSCSGQVALEVWRLPPWLLLCQVTRQALNKRGIDWLIVFPGVNWSAPRYHSV